MKLIICEKNKSAKRIAEILSNKKAKAESYYKIKYYKFDKNGEDVLVIGLKGHILALVFPPKYSDWKKVDLFDLVNAKAIKVPKLKSLIQLLKAKARKADEVIIATDFDREGELIGFDSINLIREVNPEIKIRRARFSALTSNDINKAFSNLEEPHYSLAMAGETRQEIDLSWGATLTRFISLVSNRLWKDYLSVGRVQSPTLAILVDREKKINEFVSYPYWQLRCEILKNDKKFFAYHERKRFSEREEAEKIFKKLEKSGKKGIVKSLKKKKSVKKPPSPFNTSSFLQEASKIGFSPSKAMKVAEDLYMGGYISYPRVDNTIYPSSLNLRKILKNIGNFEKISNLVEELLSQKELKPTRGKKFSPDHPPIYPTTVPDQKYVGNNGMKIYELISRRFMATLANRAIISNVKAKIEISNEIFLAKGSNIVDKGWMKFYPYLKIKEIFLPPLKVGDEVKIIKVEILNRETKPPPRFTQSRLIREMERLNLGTKSTRHEIIQNLYRRGYVQGNPVVPTKTGIVVVDVLKNHARKISSPEMTSDLENDMDKIASGEKNKEKVVKKSKQLLTNILTQLSESKEEIGKKIKVGIYEDKKIGNCPKCGSDLVIRKSKKTKKRFVGCANFPKCSQSYPIPQTGKIITTGEICQFCGAPVVKVIKRRIKPWNLCLDPDCPAKEKQKKDKNSKAKLKYKKEKKLENFGNCPSCGKQLVLREARKTKKRFLGCSNYPKCRMTFSIPQIGEIKPYKELCAECGFPQIELVSEDKTSKILCINKVCPTNK